MTERKEENSFRNILKGTSIFGGVQVFNILISAIRLKFVAVILGPSGMGVAGLFNTTSVTIQQFASLGLSLSAVKEIGQAKEDRERLSHVLAAVRPSLVMSALIGALICLLVPGLLSSLTFGNERFTGGFLLLSAAVFFGIAGSGLMSVLQGLHAVKPLSKATVIGSSVGLIIGVPLYWLYGTDGIVPAMTVIAMSTCLWYFISLKKTLEVSPSAWNKEVHLPVMKRILLMGIVLMSNDLFRNIANYLINIYIRSQGNLEEVGFYQSCSTMTIQYSSIVFTAMAMDYLPRLSAAAKDNAGMCEVVNRQIEVVGLLIAPVAGAVIFLAPWVIELLQTEKFLAAVPLLRLMAMGIVVRALMYPLGYIVFTKDNRRLFFWMESVGANLLTLLLTCGGFRLFGLNGLGYAAIADCMICLGVYIFVNNRLYGYKMTSKSLGISLFALSSCGGMLAIVFLFYGIPMILASSVLLAGISICSARGLLRRIKQDRDE